MTESQHNEIISAFWKNRLRNQPKRVERGLDLPCCETFRISVASILR